MSKISTGYAQTSYIAIPNLDARLCASVRDFVVIAPEDNLYSIRWSAINDPTDWPTPATDDARAKQSGREVLPPEFGEVTGIAGDDFYMYVFQERAVTKGTYVGGDIVFSFDTFEENRGCVRPGRMAKVDDLVIFESLHGRHLLQNDQIVDIGFGSTDDAY